MFSKINDFFQSLSRNEIDTKAQLTIEISTAVLLCEVMLADGKLEGSERKQLAHVISQQFQLNNEEVEQIITQALRLCENATDFYQFTSTINETYQLQERIKMLELLWQVAYADGEIASIEEHIIRKIADLLHLRHTEFIQTKLAVLNKSA